MNPTTTATLSAEKPPSAISVGLESDWARLARVPLVATEQIFEAQQVMARHFNEQLCRYESSNVPIKLRPEFEAVASGLQMVHKKCDPAFYQVEKALGMTLPIIFNKYAAVAGAVCILPVATIAVPVGCIALVVGFPLFFPVLVIASLLAVFNSCVVAALFFLSPYGRNKAVEYLRPNIESAMDDDILFSLFHDIGPRPSPIAVVQHSVPSNPNLQLLLCLFIDFIGGNLSYLIPLLGESFDLAWAPFQALLMGAMFDATMPSAKWLGFAEEILPFTDIIPSASLTWLRVNSHRLPLMSGKLLKGE